MKHLVATTGVALLLASGLSAQSGQGNPPVSSSKEANDAKLVTVTGCVRAGETPNSFVLANAKWDKDKDPAKSESEKKPAGTTLRLVVAAEAPQITNEHVDHTVQITGTLVPPASSSTRSETPTSTSTGTTGTGTGGEQTGQRRPASPTAEPQPGLNVRTLTIVSNTCGS